MSRKIIYTCDYCGKQECEDGYYFLSFTDAYGKLDMKQDICFPCHSRIFTRLIKELKLP